MSEIQNTENRQKEQKEQGAERCPRTLTAPEIAKILPHRYPFALVDRIEDYEPGEWARGRMCVSMQAPWFQGHFPDYPVTLFFTKEGYFKKLRRNPCVCPVNIS